MKVDATQVEINPFGETPDGRGTVRKESFTVGDQRVLCNEWDTFFRLIFGYK